MPNKNYVNAANYERSYVKWLREQDQVLFATRTPGSKSPVDVISIHVYGTGIEVHLAQLKCGKSRPKLIEIDYLKYARDRGCHAYYIVRSRGSKYTRVELEEIEGTVLRPIDPKDRCLIHPRYTGYRKPRVSRGTAACMCWDIFAQRH